MTITTCNHLGASLLMIFPDFNNCLFRSDAQNLMSMRLSGSPEPRQPVFHVITRLLIKIIASSMIGRCVQTLEVGSKNV